MSIADDMLRRLGFTARDDREKAWRYMQDLSRCQEPEAQFAKRIAIELVPLDTRRRPDPDGLVKLVLHALAHRAKPLPGDLEIRRMHIARTALEAADRHVNLGSDEGLPPELGVAARRETLRTLSLSDARRSGVDAALALRSETRSRTVAAYLSDGAPVERHMGKLLDDIPRRGETASTLQRLRENREFHPAPQPAGGPPLRAWVHEGLKAERAAARAGLLEPGRIVRIAEQTMKGADIERLSTYGRARPDFKAARTMDPDARQRTFAEASRAMQAAVPPAAGPAEIGRRTAPDRIAALHTHMSRLPQNRR